MFKGLAGYRTYIVAVGAIVAAAVSFLTGETTLGQAVNDAFMGAGLATIRAGLPK